jgi:Domain of unknown function (DUF222)/HNH endonuclease
MDHDVLALKESIDRLVESGPLVAADTDSIVALYRQFNRLEAVVTEATSSFDASADWAPDGAATASAWLSVRCSMPLSHTRRFVRRSRQLCHLPAFTRAWADGAITSAHMDAVAGVRRDSTEEHFARDEQFLCDQATELPFRDFTRVVAYWDQHADPDGTEDKEMERQARRNVYLEQTFDGLFLGKLTLDPTSGAIVSDELDRLEHELFEIDWAKAKEHLEHEPKLSDLERTSGQRRCDALKEMALRSKAMPKDAKRPAPAFTVLIDYPTLAGRVCELAQGTVIAPGALLPWLDEAIIERAVFGPKNRVEVSEKSRLFTGATRRAIELRDRECTHPYCDLPASACQVDHVIPYTDDGPTTQENGRLLCGFHNRLRNQRPPPDD